jgi:hypothetical protein
MNTILLYVIVSIIIYASGGILTIRLPFTKICQITIVDKPIDLDWSSNKIFASYANNTNDTNYNCEDSYLTSYNLAMLFA